MKIIAGKVRPLSRHLTVGHPQISIIVPPARQGAVRRKKFPRKPRRPAEPRPLALQRLAAALVLGFKSLQRVHLGAVCDAISNAGIEPDVGNARQLIDRLDAHMRHTGSTWPDLIERPDAFLASRLRQLDRRYAPAGCTPNDDNDGALRAPHRHEKSGARAAVCAITTSRRDRRTTTLEGRRQRPVPTDHPRAPLSRCNRH